MDMVNTVSPQWPSKWPNLSMSMNLQRLLAVVVLIASAILAAATAQAGIVVPSGLHPGDHYYLAFVTHDSRDATSSNISDYNQFVQNQAAQAPALTGANEGVQWRAIASTPTVNASDNLGLLSGVPIYLLGDALVGGSHPPLLVTADAGSMLASPTLFGSIGLDQFAHLWGENVWTGTEPGGTTSGANALGGASGTTKWGFAVPETFGPPYAWLNVRGGLFHPFSQQLSFNVYAISTLLTVPEPASLCLLLIGGGVLYLAGLIRHRTQKRAG
ncbi:MAG: PEP-CTERM sorting domain-containing protein [Planctomycetia bacterium]|nr:PEP-CTERM sorting domain-containing protein [Planctomycetia bacterium]